MSASPGMQDKTSGAQMKGWDEPAMKKRSIAQYVVVSLKGFCMGAADVVPGVSGGTMAFILGIYEELIAAIRSFDILFLKRLFGRNMREALSGVAWPFLAALFLGIFTAVFSLARILGWLLENRPVFIWSFFFGLVLASVFTVGRHLDRWRMATAGCMILGTIGAYWLVGMVPLSTPESPWFLILSGAVAICAMILPGISGSFILVLMGKYEYVLGAVNHRDFLTLALVALGAVVGLITFVRILSWLLKNHRDVTIAALTGLMLGALRKVWPWKKTLESLATGEGTPVVVAQANTLPSGWNSEVGLAIGLAVLGFLIVFTLYLWAGKDRGQP
jgi:putative membrane protein